jgi:hypothetical protein
MCNGSPDSERGILKVNLIETRNSLGIHQMLVAQQILLHGEKEFRPTRIKTRLLTVMIKQLGSLADSLGLMEDKAP